MQRGRCENRIALPSIVFAEREVPLRQLQSVFRPEELARLTRVLQDTLDVIVASREGRPVSEEIGRILGTAVIEHYIAGVEDFETLRAIIFERARYFGLLD